MLQIPVLRQVIEHGWVAAPTRRCRSELCVTHQPRRQTDLDHLNALITLPSCESDQPEGRTLRWDPSQNVFDKVVHLSHPLRGTEPKRLLAPGVETSPRSDVSSQLLASQMASSCDYRGSG